MLINQDVAVHTPMVAMPSACKALYFNEAFNFLKQWVDTEKIRDVVHVSKRGVNPQFAVSEIMQDVNEDCRVAVHEKLPTFRLERASDYVPEVN